MEQEVIRVHEPSLRSLQLRTSREQLNGKGPLAYGAGTGFMYFRHERYFLITNWHVITARRPDNGETLFTHSSLPDTLGVMHNDTEGPGWTSLGDYELFDGDGKAQWLVHPNHAVKPHDVIALPVDEPEGINMLAYGRELHREPTWLAPTVDVSIVGFPEGVKTIGSLAIWSRGTIATEPTLDHEDLPIFLVDSRTRRGQSGSPVISYPVTAQEPSIIDVLLGNGGLEAELHGVYSGRTSEKSDLGRVWKTHVIDEIIDGGVYDSLTRDD